MQLYGRSSSHFTRIVRIFAAELNLDAYPALRAFGLRFGARSSAKATPFRFDSPSP